MVMFIGPYSCLLCRMCLLYADWRFLEVIRLTFSLYFFLDVSQFDLYKRGDRSGIVIGRFYCAFMCWYYLFEFVYIINYIICGECDWDINARVFVGAAAAALTKIRKNWHLCLYVG
jgi:hypothetical protein